MFTMARWDFRLTVVSDTGMDVAMLREILTPTPMRRRWGPEMGWAYPGIPAAVVEQMAGLPAALQLIAAR